MHMVPKARSVPGVGPDPGKHPLFRALGPVTCYIGYQEGLGFAHEQLQRMVSDDAVSLEEKIKVPTQQNMQCAPTTCF